MVYEREIDDSALIQYIILYALGKAGRAIPYNELINLVMDNCNINYNDFQVSLDNLVKTFHVHAFLEGAHNQKYELTQKGAHANECFKSNIPIYIREPIDMSVKELFIEERRRRAVEGEITPVRDDEYTADCVLRDDDDTELLRLSIYAPDREHAEKMAVFFKEHHTEVYEKIIGIFEDNDEE